MKIVFATDFHLDAVTPGHDLRERQLLGLRALAEDCGPVDLLVLGGDIFDNSNPSPWAYEQIVRLIRCPTVLMYGNHDVGTYGLFAHLNDTLIVEYPRVCVVGGERMLFAPYMEQASTQVPLQELYDKAFDEAAKVGVKAAFCHMSVPGATGGPYMQTLPHSAPVIDLERAERLGCRVLNGHVHMPQNVGCVMMPGSLVPLSLEPDWMREEYPQPRIVGMVIE